MKDHALVERIKKLLRKAANPDSGFEGQLAGEMARDLMNRHGVEVTLDDRVRKLVPGINGNFWAENLLLTIARPRRVKLVQSTDGLHSVLVGMQRDIDEVWKIFTRHMTEMAVRCEASWGQMLDGLNVINRNFYLHKDVVDSFKQVHMEHSSRALVLKLRDTGPKPPPESPKPQGVSLPSRTSELPKKVEGLAEKLSKAVAVIGYGNASELYQAALRTGMTSGSEIDTTESLPAIAAKSTLPRSLIKPRRQYDTDDPTCVRGSLLEVD